MTVARTLIAAAVFASFVSTSTAADPTAVKDAVQMIEANDKLIVVFAWPTAKSLDGTKRVGAENVAGGGFTLTYRFDFTDSDNQAEYCTLRFTFDKNGRLTKITEVNRSMLFPTFGAAKVVLELVKAEVKEQIKQGKKRLEDYQTLLAIDDPTEFLVEVLNITAGK